MSLLKWDNVYFLFYTIRKGSAQRERKWPLPHIGQSARDECVHKFHESSSRHLRSSAFVGPINNHNLLFSSTVTIA
jgi:hypothetical protein